MKKIINNKHADFYLNAAVTLGLDYKILNRKAALAQIYNESKTLTLSANVLDLNTFLSGILATNKEKTSLLLQDNDIPVPAFQSFENIRKATKYAIELLQSGKEFVVKPLTGSLAVGITINPTTEQQVRNAIKEAFAKDTKILIEDFIQGLHYRVTVLDDEIVAITERTAAYVIGDGKRSVTELIEQKNKTRLQMKLPPVTLRNKDYDYLSASTINLSDIHGKGVYVKLQLGCDLDIGGERRKIAIDTVPQRNKEMFVRAIKSLNMRFAGIDYISPDITLPYTKIDTAINEINSSPHPEVHYMDSYPYNNYAAERILEKIFEKGIDTEEESSESSLYSPFLKGNTTYN